jgi:hypothetical protein
MTHDEIIAMAKQAGLPGYPDEILAFAKLVAAKAIAELESQEPVGEVGWAANVPNTIKEVHWKNGSPPIGTKLFTHPPQRTEQEPVAQPASEEDMKIYRAVADNYRKELTHPPQRTWVGLTEEEICMFSMWLDSKPDATVFTAIEARLKELNT